MEKCENILPIDFHEWGFLETLDSNKGEKCYVSDPRGDTKFGVALGDYGWNWTDFRSEILQLAPNSSYVCNLWTRQYYKDWNGTLDFSAILDEDWESRQLFHIKGGYFNPSRIYGPWEYYSFPFTTGDSGRVRLCLNVVKHVGIFIPADELSTYEDLPPWPDEAPAQKNRESACPLLEQLADKVAQRLSQQVGDRILDEVDIDAIADNLEVDAGEVAGCLDLSELAQEIADSLDVEEIADALRDDVLAALTEDAEEH